MIWVYAVLLTLQTGCIGLGVWFVATTRRETVRIIWLFSIGLNLILISLNIISLIKNCIL